MLPAVASTTKFIVKYKKPIAYTIGGLLAAYLIYKAYKIAFPGGVNEDRTLPKATITNTQAITVAERLLQAMYGGGTDEDTIYNALKDLSHNDFVKVADAFGIKPYFHPTGELGIIPWLSDDMDLVEWLIAELSASEIAKLKKILPKVF